MEHLNIEFSPEELEIIGKANNQSFFPFPVVHVGAEVLIFNSLAAPYLPTTGAIKWFCSTEYIIGLPSVREDAQAFSLVGRKGRRYKAVRFPQIMKQEKKLKEGFYKLYKYKNGIAFKRYDPIKI